MLVCDIGENLDQDLEVELSNLTQIISEQKGELLSLRDKAKNMPSEKEVSC